MTRQERTRALGEALRDLGHVQGAAMALVDLVERELGESYVSPSMATSIGFGLKRAQENILDALAFEEEEADVLPLEETP